MDDSNILRPLEACESGSLMEILSHSHWYGDQLHILQQLCLRENQQLAKIHVLPRSEEPTTNGCLALIYTKKF